MPSPEKRKAYRWEPRKNRAKVPGPEVGADDGAHIADDHILGMVGTAEGICQVFCILQAVSMADEEDLIARIDAGLSHLSSHGIDGRPAAPGFGHIYQVPQVIHVEHRLDFQHGTHDGRQQRFFRLVSRTSGRPP